MQKQLKCRKLTLEFSVMSQWKDLYYNNKKINAQFALKD
jgi:hypothetical protein